MQFVWSFLQVLGCLARRSSMGVSLEVWQVILFVDFPYRLMYFAL